MFGSVEAAVTSCFNQVRTHKRFAAGDPDLTCPHLSAGWGSSSEPITSPLVAEERAPTVAMVTNSLQTVGQSEGEPRRPLPHL